MAPPTGMPTYTTASDGTAKVTVTDPIDAGVGLHEFNARGPNGDSLMTRIFEVTASTGAAPTRRSGPRPPLRHRRPPRHRRPTPTVDAGPDRGADGRSDRRSDRRSGTDAEAAGGSHVCRGLHR